MYENPKRTIGGGNLRLDLLHENYVNVLPAAALFICSYLKVNAV